MLLLRHSIGNASPLESLARTSKSVPHLCCYATPPPTENCARLQLYGGNKLAIVDNKKVPLFGRAKEPWKFQRLAGEDVCRRHTGSNEQMGNKLAEPDHLRATGHRATGTLVRSTLRELSLLLPLARTPIVGDSLRYLLVEGG